MPIRPFFFLIVSLVCFSAGTGLYFFFNTPVSPQVVAADVATLLEKDLADADSEAEKLIAAPGDKNLWVSVAHRFFLVDSGKIKSWSKNDFTPDWHAALSMFSEHLIQTSGGDYLVKKWPMQQNSFLVLVIPLRKKYDLVNNYLKTEWNQEIFSAPVRIYGLASKRGAAVCVTHDGCLFAVDPDGDTVPGFTDYVALMFFVAGILCLMVFAGIGLQRLHRAARYQTTFVWMAAFLFALRIALVEIGFPNFLIKFSWFDPKQFASSSFNASIGDLFLNSVVVLMLCLYLFIWHSRFPVVRKALRASRRRQGSAIVICLLISFLALLFPFLYGEIIYHNSSISLEISTSLIFGTTRVIAFLSLLIGCCSAFLVLHAAIHLVMRLVRRARYPFLLFLGVASFIFAAFFILTGRDYWITLMLGLALFSIIFFFRLSLPLSRLTFKSFIYFLLIVVVFSLQSALSIRHFQEEKQALDLVRYGNNFLVDEDVLGEYLLNESIRRISRDSYIQLKLSSPFLSKSGIRQKIRLFYLPGYFDRYDVKVYLFDARGEGFGNDRDADFYSVQTWQQATNHTSYEGIYFIDNPTREDSRKYVAVVPVNSRFGVLAGFVVLDLTLKKIIPQNVYPELLVDNRFGEYTSKTDISYAYYSHGRLTGSFGNFNYEKDFRQSWLQLPALFRNGINTKGFHHAGIQDDKDRQVVVSGKRYPSFFVVTNFSFFFILGLAFLLCFLFVTGIMASLRGRRLAYSSRIQLYVYLAFFFPLVAVSITTLSLISRANKDRLTREYAEKARMLGEQMAAPLELYSKGAGETQPDFQNHLAELARLANSDVSIYSPGGFLMASSQPAIFENHLVSPFLNRRALNAIAAFNDNSFLADETIGSLQYSSSYAAIKSPETGKLLGILSLPFFSSAASLEQSQITVLANILTVFVIIFILFSFLSFFIATGLTFPLRFIRQSLQKTSLTETNPLIAWNSRDEIGLLAQEYNRMVQNLEQSRAELVRSQKESTWRELAKQVAHEIKNPLTPMKLTLQQWERNLIAGDRSDERDKKSIDILLKQLETLNTIAGSFSAFARMPAPVLEHLDIAALIKRAVDLHAPSQEGVIRFSSASGSIFVLGDDQLFSRIFSNLLLNALQSGQGRKVNVGVLLTKQADMCRVEISDDGAGIDVWVRDRVFLPHFSTKRTGSGLGLAIVRQGIEQAGGRIWFETETGKGTTFFVELPVG